MSTECIKGSTDKNNCSTDDIEGSRDDIKTSTDSN